jgi:hypothetical protein
MLRFAVGSPKAISVVFTAIKRVGQGSGDRDHATILSFSLQFVSGVKTPAGRKVIGRM